MSDSATGFSRFASPAVKQAIGRRVNEVLGILLGFAGLALLVAVGTHHSGDPSLSTATSGPVHNLAGPLGAMVSDVLWQSCGWAAYLPGAVLLGWAIRMIAQRGVSLLPLRVIMLMLAAPMLAALLALLPGADAGVAGPLLADALLRGLEGAFGPLGRLTAQLVTGGLAALLIYVALGASPSDWRRAARVTADAARVTADTAARGVGEAAGYGARKRHLLARPFVALGGLFRRRRRVEPAADLVDVLKEADRAAAAPAPFVTPYVAPPSVAPEVRPPLRQEPEIRPAPRSTPRVAPTAKPKAPPEQASLDLPVEGWRTPPLDLLAPHAAACGRWAKRRGVAGQCPHAGTGAERLRRERRHHRNPPRPRRHAL
jgi:DNA segregation ATPase FtsK/SpoIIIE, S-DNA-T family